MKKFSITELVITLVLLAMLSFCVSENIQQKEIDSEKTSKETSETSSNEKEYESTQKEEQNIIKEDTENIVKKNENLEIYYFYVGQADCILIKNGDDTMLIDAGNNKDGKLICNYLKNELGIKKINYLVGTHAHEDHIGGLDNVIKTFEVGQIYMPKKGTTTQTYTEILDAAEKKNVSIKSPKIGEKFNIGDAKCEVLFVDDTTEELNNNSIVISMKYGNQKYLFTGDIEEIVENQIDWDDVDVLKVAHHGSRTSTSKEFLSETKPEVAILSLGKDNEYGYPHSTTINKLNNINADVYRTDSDGTILLTSDGIKNTITKLDVSLDGN